MNDKVITCSFIALCTLSFLALCNVAIFFNFYDHLLDIGIESKKAGFLVGLSSLSAVVLYITASTKITLGNARKLIITGMILLALCGVLYQFANSFWSIALLRICNGSGMFLVMASCMVMLVANIPPEQSGFAFSIYSVALLAPYSVVPAFIEFIHPWITQPTKIYMLIGILLLPSLLLLPFIRSSKHRDTGPSRATTFSASSSIRKNIFQKPVLSILLVNTVYFTLFSGLFYLFKGFAESKGILNAGYFFTIQMGVMVLIRIVAGKVFDSFSKTILVCVSLILTAFSFFLLTILPSSNWIFPTAIIFGLGMGFTVPPLNALMFLVAEPQYRGFNSNMMMLTVQMGTFLGPFCGAIAIDAGGYNFFLISASVLTLCGSIFFLLVNPSKSVLTK